MGSRRWLARLVGIWYHKMVKHGEEKCRRRCRIHPECHLRPPPPMNRSANLRRSELSFPEHTATLRELFLAASRRSRVKGRREQSRDEDSKRTAKADNDRRWRVRHPRRSAG